MSAKNFLKKTCFSLAALLALGAHAQQVMDRIRGAGFTLTIRDPNET